MKSKDIKTVALIGNPNCGKTSLYNILTGSSLTVGNRPGVTVELKSGKLLKNKDVVIVDLPGLYSLQPNEKDEKVVTEFLKNTPPDLIINVVDGTHLERNLFLSLSVKELGIPAVMAVNFCDDLNKNGTILKEEILSQEMGLPILKISALKNIGIEELIKLILLDKIINEKKEFPKEDKKRYEFIENLLNKCLSQVDTKTEKRTVKIDNILTHKVWGIPIMLFAVFMMYLLPLKIGGVFSDLIMGFFNNAQKNLYDFFISNNFPMWLNSLLSVGIMRGIGAVFALFPQILILFLILIIYEETGYTSRISFNLDRIFRVFGLSGKSIIPLALSCGCTASGIMSTRTVENEKERESTIMLCPFLPCGAKTAVFSWLSYRLFNGSVFVTVFMYFLGLFMVAIVGSLLKNNCKNCNKGGVFILEMPNYRLPALKNIYYSLRQKTVDFFLKTGTIIFGVCISVWLLQNFGITGYTNGDITKSFLFYIGNFIKYIFYPLGFFKWEISVSLLSGLFAKEAVIETLEMIGEDVSLIFANSYNALSFMSFILLMPPCLSALICAKNELKSRKKFIFMLFLESFIAYIVAMVINLVGFLIEKNLILKALVVIIITVAVVVLLLNLKKHRCMAHLKRRSIDGRDKNAI